VIWPLRYLRASTVDEAVALLMKHPRASVLAGGQSLLPLLKAGRAKVDTLVDVGRLTDLCSMRQLPQGGLEIGAAVRHEQVATDPVLSAGWGLLAAAAACVGDPQVRAMGTLGGSLAVGDPRADLAVAALALDARVQLRGPTGVRAIDVGELAGPRGRRRNELITRVLLDCPADRGAEPPRFSYMRFTHRAESWPMVAVAVIGGPAPRIAVGGLAEQTARATAVERAVRDGADPPTAAHLVTEGVDVAASRTASAEYRAHLATVLVRRALTEVGR
jgi:carbon-monoxide dehydrogenase medium subunit